VLATNPVGAFRVRFKSEASPLDHALFAVFLWLFRCFLVFAMESMRARPRTWVALLLCGVGGAYATVEGRAAFDRENCVLAATAPHGGVARAERAAVWAHGAYFAVLAAELCTAIHAGGRVMPRRAVWLAAALAAAGAATLFAKVASALIPALAFTVAPAVVFSTAHLLLAAMALAWFGPADSQAYVDLGSGFEPGAEIDVGALSSSPDE
jgi:hypothetical protein